MQSPKTKVLSKLDLFRLWDVLKKMQKKNISDSPRLSTSI